MKRLYIYGVLASALSFGSCASTDSIPEGEQLYTGIQRIEFHTQQTTKSQPEVAAKDSAGVITAIANAVEEIDELVSGTKNMRPRFADLQQRDPSTLTKAERATLKAQQKAQKEAVEAARTEVEAVLAYAPNGAIFGSSSFTTPWNIGLWAHDTFKDSQTAVGKWLFKAFGEAPILVTNVAPATRTKVATNTLRNYGFFQGKVDYDILTQSDPKKAKIAYHVTPGNVYFLDSIEYRKFALVPDSLLRHTRNECFLRKGEAFSTQKLMAEQTRIETLMRNNGYYFFSPAYTTFEADTLAQPGYVQLRVQPSANIPDIAQRPWYIGHTYINIRNLDNASLNGSLLRRNFSFAFPGNKIPLRTGMWRNAIAHKRGERYSLADQKSTFDRLYAMGVLSAMDIDYIPRDSSATCDTLDLYINATLGRAYDSSFEMNATLKSNQQVGPGVSYELAKHNAFRAGETVAWKIFGSYEWHLGGGRNGGNPLMNSFELGTQLSFKFPRLLLPWNTSAQRRRQRAKQQAEQQQLLINPSLQPFRYGKNHPIVGSTTYAINADWKNRSGFFQMANFGGNVLYKWYRHPEVDHELTAFHLEYNRLFNTTAVFDSIMDINPALAVSMRNQLVPSIAYTITYQTRRTNPFWLQASVKEAGNLLSGIYAAAGKSWSENDKQLLGSPFAQFVKATLEARYTYHFTPHLKLATRAFAGAVYSYGNSSRAPYAEQFYIGGANSVRAFSARSAGPGAFYDPSSQYAYIDQTGEAKFEANVELRSRLFGSLHGAVFVDAGNVWLLRPDDMRPMAELSLQNLKHVALGTGFGLRYDLQYLVVRFDVGIALHAPYSITRTGFYNLPRFWDGVAYHLAIGYPF